MKQIDVKITVGAYPVLFVRGGLSHADEFFNLNRRVLVLTDSGVPAVYAKTVAEKCKEGIVHTVTMGEGAKSLEVLSEIEAVMLAHHFTRSDALVAVGGGVVGDLGGFAASIYMRGIDFYNIPTTTLSAVDSSVGGKTAVNFGGVKNIIGTFYQPRAVLIDAEVLRTLPPRQISSGLAEAVKMALCFDSDLFSHFENNEITLDNIDEVLYRSIAIKASVVEKDEREGGLRKMLNFGHTFGHAIEAGEGLSGLTHGECVALGMLPLCSPSVRVRLLSVLEKLNLPTVLPRAAKDILHFIDNDKKRTGDEVDCIIVEKLGEGEIRRMPLGAFKARILNFEKGDAV